MVKPVIKKNDNKIRMRLRTVFIAASMLVVTFIGNACSQSGKDSGEYIIFPAIGNIYSELNFNAFESADKPSAFALYTNTASYPNFRLHAKRGYNIDPAMVRTEEFINYFSYDYPLPQDSGDVALNYSLFPCPWERGEYLLRLGLKTRELSSEHSALNLVLLVDVSGSMAAADRLPLAKAALISLLRRLAADGEILAAGSRISLVAYSGSAHVVLDGETHLPTITDAVEQLAPGGMSYGQAGIALAYEMAEKNYIDTGTNRIVLITDGDFNIGGGTAETLKGYISDRTTEFKNTGRNIVMDAAGFGYGNLNDANLAVIAAAGGGTHTFVDSPAEAQHFFASSSGHNLSVFADDAKVLVQFNARAVSEYKLLGYENSLLSYEQWLSGYTDAGALGYGHTATALYQLRLKPAAVAAMEQHFTDIAEFSLSYNQRSPKQNVTVSVMATSGAYTAEIGAQDTFISLTAHTALVLRGEIERGSAGFMPTWLTDKIDANPAMQSQIFSDIFKEEFYSLLSQL